MFKGNKTKFTRLVSLITAIVMLAAFSSVCIAAENSDVNILSGITPVLNHKTGQSVSGTASALTDGAAGNGYTGTSWVLRSDYHYHNNNYATFTLNEAKKANKFILTSASSGIAVHYAVEYSTDNGATWEKAGELNNNTETVSTLEFNTVEASMYRVQMIFNYATYEEAYVNNAPAAYYRVGEMALCYNEPAVDEEEEIKPEPGVNVLSGITPVLNHKSGQSVSGTASALTDGAAGNGYSGTSWVLRSDYHYHNNNYATFTLPTAKMVNKLVLTSASSGIAAHYAVEYSTDNGTTWKKAGELNNNTETVSTLKFDAVAASMFRVQMIFNYSTYEEAFVNGSPAAYYRVGEIELSYEETISDEEIEANPGVNVFAGITPVLNHKSGQSISGSASALTDSEAGGGYTDSSWVLRSDYHFHNNNYATFTLDGVKKVNTLKVMSKEVTVNGKKSGLATHFVLESSSNGTSWTKVAEIDNNTDEECVIFFNNEAAKMWRVQFVFNYDTYEEAYADGPVEQYRVGEIALSYEGDELCASHVKFSDKDSLTVKEMICGETLNFNANVVNNKESDASFVVIMAVKNLDGVLKSVSISKNSYTVKSGETVPVNSSVESPESEVALKCDVYLWDTKDMISPVTDSITLQ